MGKLTNLLLALFVCSIACSGVAQQTATVPLSPSYEVASIKPSNATDNRAMLMFREGRLQMKNFPLIGLISFAYDIKSDTLLTSVPEWVKSERYDVEAKEEEAEAKEVAKLPQEERTKISRLMAQKLLTERLHLKLVPEPKELPVYLLVVAKSGAKLQPAKPPVEGQEPAAGPGGPRMRRGIMMSGPGDFSGMDATVELLANVVSHVPETSDRLVIDKTGLTGHYDFHLKWTPEMAGSAARGNDGATAEAGPSLFTALEEQLGLRLERGKETVTTYRVEAIDHPTEN
ncbi:TIGR03435 family protein [Terriglobus tenax]|uniref:TIGR03435 family protein n=1 Tax=Terriglobus tenax TaxID=1111115 RepID=UPI0021E0C5B6|nr:TIGR03435 family protein [Terriglobus tenax]